MDADDLSSITSMRDVFDYCNKHKLHSVAQGMIELPPPQKLREIASAMLLETDSDIHTYRARFGVPEYREGLRRFLKNRYSTDVSVDSILATAGVTGGIVSALYLLRKQGKDRVALLEPFYTYHGKQVEAVLGVPPSHFIASNSDFSPDFDKIKSSISGDGGAQALILCNPGNPHGRCLRKDEMERLVALTKENDVLLIVDEIYCDMVFGKMPHYSPVQDGLNENVVVCRGFSKTLAVQSWRVGYVVSHPNTINALMPLHDPIYICVSWVQHALAKYITDHEDDFFAHTSTLNAMLKSNWEVLSEAFCKVMGWEVAFEPEGAMYGMFAHKSESDTAAMQAALLKGVGVSPGNIFFGGDDSQTGFVRIHVGMSAENARTIAAALLSASE